MGRFKKVLFLFLALLLPIAVFVFLKSFGKNEFAVKPLFQETVESSVNCKSVSYKVPYFVHDSVLSQVGWINTDSITLLILKDGSTENKNHKSTLVDRIITEISSKSFHVVYLSEQMNDSITNSDNN